MPNQRRRSIGVAVVLSVLSSVLLLLVAGCGAESSQPRSATVSSQSNIVSPATQGGAIAEVATVAPQRAQVSPQQSSAPLSPQQLSTLSAATDKSGKTGPPLPGPDVTSPSAPTLPPGGQTNPPGQDSSGQSVAHQGTQATGVGAAPPALTAQATPGTIPLTLSPEESATREAALAQSGRPGQPLPESSQSTGLGSGVVVWGAVGAVLLLSAFGLALRRRR